MKVIKVQYSVNEDFIEKNKENIQNVMAALRQTGNTAVYYSASNNGNNFLHTVIYKSDDESLPSSLPEFSEFQVQLKENLENPPAVEEYQLVDSNFD